MLSSERGTVRAAREQARPKIIRELSDERHRSTASREDRQNCLTKAASPLQEDEITPGHRSAVVNGWYRAAE